MKVFLMLIMLIAVQSTKSFYIIKHEYVLDESSPNIYSRIVNIEKSNSIIFQNWKIGNVYYTRIVYDSPWYAEYAYWVSDSSNNTVINLRTILTNTPKILDGDSLKYVTMFEDSIIRRLE